MAAFGNNYPVSKELVYIEDVRLFALLKEDTLASKSGHKPERVQNVVRRHRRRRFIGGWDSSHVSPMTGSQWSRVVNTSSRITEVLLVRRG